MKLTDGFIRKQWLVIKAKNLSYVVEIWMLNNKSPQRVVEAIVEVSNCYFHSPVLLVVHLDMPMYPNWAHMVSAL